MLELILSENTLNVKSLEQEIFKYVCDIGRDIMKTILESLDKVIAAERDTKTFENRGPRKTTIKTVMGEVEYKRNIYRVHGGASGEKKHIFLLDKMMGFDTIGCISSTLAEMIANGACVSSYAETAKSITEQTGQSISHTGVWNVVQKLGERVEKREDELVQAYKHDLLHGELERKVIFEEADGVMISLQGKDRKKYGKKKECRIAISYDGCVKTAEGRYELHNKDVTVGYERMSVIKDKKEAKIAQRYNTDEIELRIFNSDGAASLKALHAEDTQFQLDRFHVEQAIRRNIQDKGMRKTVSKLYRDGEIGTLLEYLEAMSNSVEDEGEGQKIEELYRYLNNNKEGLIPYNERGIAIPEAPEGLEYNTLGTCEHNVYNIAARRMKKHGASWSVQGSSNLGKLLGLKAMHKLPETIENLSKQVLPERYKDGIIKVLSAGRVPKKVGKGYIGKHCEIPFTGASVTEGRKAIQRIFGMKALSELQIKF